MIRLLFLLLISAPTFSQVYEIQYVMVNGETRDTICAKDDSIFVKTGSNYRFLTKTNKIRYIKPTVTVPQSNISFTNEAGYITGINSGNVTTALGFTPANAADMAGKQNTITPGSTAQYIKGDFSLGTFPTTTSFLSNSTNKNFVTDAQATVISNTSGTNTGDNAVNSNYSSLVTNANHTGDATGSTALTLATVNSNVGSFTNASITVNGKGLITAACASVTKFLFVEFERNDVVVGKVPNEKSPLIY